MDLKFLKRKKRFKKGGSQIKPDLYWKYILLVAFILFIISCVFAFSLLTEINKKLILSTENVNRQETIDKEKLKEVLEYFSKRKLESTKILNFPSPIIDPSL